MAPNGNGQRIVRTWTNLNAPTGEGGIYETEDGSVWRDAPWGSEPKTGERLARIEKGRVHE